MVCFDFACVSKVGFGPRPGLLQEGTGATLKKLKKPFYVCGVGRPSK